MNKDKEQMIQKSLKVLVAILIFAGIIGVYSAFIFEGLSSNKTITEDKIVDKVDYKEIEPKKQLVEEKAESQGYTYLKDITEANTKLIPQVYKGYYVVPTRAGKLAIFDQSGEEATSTLYKKAYYTSSGELVMIREDGMAESFGYAIGKEPTNEVEGDAEGSPDIYAYNRESGDVVKSTMFDKEWTKAVPVKNGTYIISEVSDVENGNVDGKKYYWNTYTNKVYNVPTDLFSDTDLFDYYKNNPFVQYINTIYSVRATAQDKWQVVDKDKITKKEYEDAMQVAPDTVFARNGSNCLLTSTIDEAIELPESATSSTGMNGNTIMLKEDGVWKLYERNTDNKQE